MTVTVVPIGSLGSADSLDGTEQVPLNQTGRTKRSTSGAFVTLASGIIVPVAVASAVATSEAYTDSKFPVPNTQLASMVQATVKGRASGAGTGIPQDLTPAQVTAILNLFTSVLAGLVPASGGGTANFLRADGTWAPAGGGGGGTNMAFATGYVLDDGTVNAGQNIDSVDHSSTGRYKVTYTADLFYFDPTETVLWYPTISIGPGFTGYLYTFYQVSPFDVEVLIYNPATLTLTDSEFSFSASSRAFEP